MVSVVPAFTGPHVHSVRPSVCLGYVLGIWAGRTPTGHRRRRGGTWEKAMSAFSDFHSHDGRLPEIAITFAAVKNIGKVNKKAIMTPLYIALEVAVCAVIALVVIRWNATH